MAGLCVFLSALQSHCTADILQLFKTICHACVDSISNVNTVLFKRNWGEGHHISIWVGGGFEHILIEDRVDNIMFGRRPIRFEWGEGFQCISIEGEGKACISI